MTVAVMPPSDGAPLPRAASYTFLPTLAEAGFDEAKGSFFEDDLIGRNVSHELSGPLAPGILQTELGDEPSTGALPKLDTSDSSAPQSAPPVEGPPRRPSFSRSLSQRLRSQSWMPGSRSPSPSKAASSDQNPAATSPRTPNRLTRRAKPNSELRKVNRPTSEMSNGAASECTTPIERVRPTTAGLPKSWSSEKLSEALRSIPSSERVPPVPRVGSTERLRNLKPDFRKKDELWSVFRTLDGDVQK